MRRNRQCLGRRPHGRTRVEPPAPIDHLRGNRAVMLEIPEAEIRRHGPGNVLAVFWRQRQVERDLARRGIEFRTTDEKAVESAYAAMSDQEFEAINGRQAWANWR